MSDMAKKYREAMKGKARRLAGEKDQKTDSSDWTPAEPLNADVKTGMRPISRRAYKSGGAVEGSCSPKNLGRKPRKAGGKISAKEMAEEKSEAAEYAKAKINRDAKAANEEREGIKHIGGLKKGGRAKREDGGATNAQPSGGIRSRIRDFLKKIHPGDPAVQREQLRDVGTSQTSNIPAEDRARMERMSGDTGMKKGGRAARKDGGKIATTLAGQEKIQKEQAAASKPTRGKAEHYNKGGYAKKNVGGPMADPRMSMVKPKAMEFAGAQGTPYKKGGKAESFNCVPVELTLEDIDALEEAIQTGGLPETVGFFFGKTTGDEQILPVPLPAAGGMPPAPMGGLGAMGGMPMPPAPPAMPGRPMARKAGGRVAKSYKDMTAGAGSGVGRLQKTEIESRKG